MKRMPMKKATRYLTLFAAVLIGVLGVLPATVSAETTDSFYYDTSGDGKPSVVMSGDQIMFRDAIWDGSKDLFAEAKKNSEPNAVTVLKKPDIKNGVKGLKVEASYCAW